MRYHGAIPEQLLQACQEILRIFLALSYPKVSYAKAFIQQLAVCGQNDDRNFRVVGVFDKVGQIGAFDMDNNIVVPSTTANQYLLGANHYTIIMVRIQTGQSVERAADDIRQSSRPYLA